MELVFGDVDPPDWLFLWAGSFSASGLAGLIGLIVLLIASSALISGSEIAYFAIKPDQYREFGKSENKKERLIHKLLSRPRYLLATILIANNFINIAIILTSNFIINELFQFSPNTNWPNWLNASYPFILKVVLVTFIIIFFGEILPKVYATQRGSSLASFMSKPLLFLRQIFRPLSTFLVKSSNIIENRLMKGRKESVSVDELDMAIDLAVDQDKTTEEEVNMLKSIVRFGDIAAKDVMTPRPDIFGISTVTSYLELTKLVREKGFSRIPIYEQDLDAIKGVLYVKDMLPHLEKPANFDWSSLIREALFVPENKKIDTLLEDFQEHRMHMAIAVDEYGGTAGLVTLEDVLEEIIGEIKDEFDDLLDNIYYEKINNNTYIFKGKASLFDLCKIIEQDFSQFDKDKGESDSLAGLVLELAGKIPPTGTVIKYNNFSFTVLEADKKRITKVKVKMNEK